MADKLSSTQRRYCMSRIRGKNTRPEILVRKGLHARGFRFRLHNKKLPGSPDIVLPKYGVAIMVNGCFWHGHKGCRYATSPKSNIEFWGAKIARNRHRDEVTEAHLLALGWHVITIWECELRGASSADSRIDKLAEEIREAGAALLERKTLHASDRLETQRKTRELMERQARLEAEINALYPIPKKVKMESRTEI
jgi:DNA mismatch endonuclease (patch repair protein)